MKLKNNIRLLITCDSGAAAGKTTAAKYLSKKFNLNLLTSGLLYRYIAYKLLKSKKTSKNMAYLKSVIGKINSRTLKNPQLYSAEVTEFTFKVAKIKKIRKLLKNYQNKFAKKRLALVKIIP